MSAPLTEQEFSKHLKTKFRVNCDDPIELELTEVKGYLSQAHEQTGMERFSAFFLGPGDRYLRQKVYSLAHEQMGTFEIFLVPVSRDEAGYRYEAVFNYFKEK
ncbi:MAG TPA: hypothetical protein VF088_13720 [Pyrinomonadaceae bacterium]